MATTDSAPSEILRKVSHRCTNMAVHSASNGHAAVPMPCPDCFSVEMFWRRVPYEPDSEHPATPQQLKALVPKHPRYHGDEASRGDDTVGTAASSGMFKVIGVDTFDRDPDAHWVYAEWPSLEQAKECADAHGAPMNKTHVYDDRGRHVYEAGSM